MAGATATSRLLAGGLVLILVILGGCGGKLKKLMGEKVPPSEYYVDASRGFAIEHPQNWPAATREHNRVSWNVPTKKAWPGAIRVGVTVLRPEQAVGGYDALLQIFRQEHPDFNPADREKIDLPTAPAERLTGATSERSYLLVLLTAEKGAYILSFSTLPAAFDQNRPVFEDMLRSFRILAEAPAAP